MIEKAHMMIKIKKATHAFGYWEGGRFLYHHEINKSFSFLHKVDLNEFFLLFNLLQGMRVHVLPHLVRMQPNMVCIDTR